jgi:hypothetical protein
MSRRPQRAVPPRGAGAVFMAGVPLPKLRFAMEQAMRKW